MKRLLLLLTLLGALAAAQDVHILPQGPVVTHAPAPLDFRGYWVGMTVDQLRQHYVEREAGARLKSGWQDSQALQCEDRGARAQRCFGLREPLVVCFLDGKLVSISWEMGRVAYLDTYHALKDKFGPAQESLRQYSNAMGGKFEGLVATWKSGAATLEIQQYGTTMSKFGVELSDPGRYQEYIAVARGSPDI